MKKRRQSAGGVVRWTLTAVSLVALVLWIAIQGHVWIVSVPIPSGHRAISGHADPEITHLEISNDLGSLGFVCKAAKAINHPNRRFSLPRIRFSEPRAGIEIPHWLTALAIVGSTSVAWWRSLTIEQRRRYRNECLACGYSRTGLAPDSPCPECGTLPQTEAAG